MPDGELDGDGGGAGWGRRLVAFLRAKKATNLRPRPAPTPAYFLLNEKKISIKVLTSNDN